MIYCHATIQIQGEMTEFALFHDLFCKCSHELMVITKGLVGDMVLWMCYRFNASLLIKTHQNQNFPRKLWRSQCVAINYAITINLNISQYMKYHVFMGIV